MATDFPELVLQMAVKYNFHQQNCPQPKLLVLRLWGTQANFPLTTTAGSLEVTLRFCACCGLKYNVLRFTSTLTLTLQKEKNVHNLTADFSIPKKTEVNRSDSFQIGCLKARYALTTG